MQRMRSLLNPFDVNMVVYHGYCTDGFGAAWVASTVLGPMIEYVPVTYSKSKTELPFDPTGKNIVMVDFSFDLATCQMIKDRAKNFIILDHHKTAEETLSQLDYSYFDMNKSGITLAWEYFRNDSVPEFVRCIETHDIWKFEERKETCPHAKAFTAYWYNEVGHVPATDFAKYDQVFYDTTLFYMYVENGRLLLRYMHNLVKNKAESATDMYYLRDDGVMLKAKVINTDTLISELGHYLASMPDVNFVAMWTYSHTYKNYRISLRSDGTTDVSAIAKKFGGGGHHAASGFTLWQHPDTIFSLSSVNQ